MEERYIACMAIHGLGDTIGFRNSEWEFMSGNTLKDRVLEKVYEYVDFGGVNHIPTKDWIISDDTLMHVRIAKALLGNYNNVNEFGNLVVKEFLDVLAFFEQNDEGIKRAIGVKLREYLRRLKSGGKWNDTPYDYNAGGSGASMRNPCIGLAYHGIKNRHNLIQMSIESSRITHNSASGYLGGMTSALFTAYAIEKIPIKRWPFLLMELFENSTIDEYISKTGRNKKEYFQDSPIFIDKWQTYIRDKFDNNSNIIKRKADKNLIHRTKYYYETFRFRGNAKEENSYAFSGSGGDDSVIIAYDALIDSGNNWEKLIFYSMLHGGDTDTTGCIAGAWYGALYGFGEVPKHRIQMVENIDELISLGKKLFEKFN
jgi:ADP-ribosylarginine hydrolase